MRSALVVVVGLDCLHVMLNKTTTIGENDREEDRNGGWFLKNKELRVESLQELLKGTCIRGTMALSSF